jgi:hypothetical protein
VDYKRIYKEFIADRRKKQKALKASGEYYETHHIKPRYQGGSNHARNLIALTASDHFFAHLVYAKAHGGKAWAAVWAMTSIRGERAERDRRYAMRCRRWYETVRLKASENNSGERHANARAVINLNTGESFVSTFAAGQSLGASHTGICRAAAEGGRFGGSFWRYLDEVKDLSADGLKAVRDLLEKEARQRSEEGNKRAAKKRTKYTKASLQKVADQCASLEDFYTRFPNEYRQAVHHKWLDEIASELPRQSTPYCRERALKIVSQYKSRSAFAREHQSLYRSVLHNGDKEAVLGHLPEKANAVSFTDMEIRETVAECESIMDLHKKNRQMYTFLWKRGLLNQLFPNTTAARPKRVRNVSTGEEFDSITAAAKACDVSGSHITGVCKGRRKSAGGYRWEYVEAE